MYVLKAEKRLTVLHMLIEGNSIRSVERLTGVHRDTVMRLLVKAGERCRDLLDRRLRNMHLSHLQIDEIWTFVAVKQARILEGADDTAIGDQYLYVALDQDTKLIASFAIGKRNRAVTERFMLDLASRVVHNKEEKPQISSDGWPAYPGAVDLAFANEAYYGQIIKDFAEGEQPGRYGPPNMVAVDRRPFCNINPSTICTSHVERNNLTLRTFIKRFARLSLGFSKKLENLAAAVALHTAHYNFCRRHSSLRMTPAMAAGLVDELWSLDRLIKESGL